MDEAEQPLDRAEVLRQFEALPEHLQASIVHELDARMKDNDDKPAR